MIENPDVNKRPKIYLWKVHESRNVVCTSCVVKLGCFATKALTINPLGNAFVLLNCWFLLFVAEYLILYCSTAIDKNDQVLVDMARVSCNLCLQVRCIVLAFSGFSLWQWFELLGQTMLVACLIFSAYMTPCLFLDFYSFSDLFVIWIRWLLRFEGHHSVYVLDHLLTTFPQRQNNVVHMDIHCNICFQSNIDSLATTVTFCWTPSF